ncbi:MAG: hypothetical protein NTW52_18225 [Planctomycetota bacterium]|nr:hypothetical protein [Planctomycetota bacterium]
MRCPRRWNGFVYFHVVLVIAFGGIESGHFIFSGIARTLAAESSPVQQTATPISVKIKLLSGATVEGDLQSVNTSTVTIRTGVDNKSVVTEFPVAETAVIELKGVSPSDATSSGDILKLTDGTSLQCRSILGKDNSWSVESESNVSLSITPSTMASLQFRNLNKAVREAASQNAGAPVLTDEMLIIRPGDQIDRIPGVILGLDESSVSFSFDGQTIPAPRTKLAGLVWAQPEESPYKPTIRIRTLDGSKWEATELKFVDSGEKGPVFQWTLRSGIECVCDPKQVASIDFSNAIVRWFAAIAVIESKAFDNPFLSVSVRGRSVLLAPHFASNSKGRDIADEPSTKNLVFPVDGEIVARVPDGTTRFRTRIVRPEDARIQDKILCEIWSNEDLLWSSADPKVDAPWVVDIAVTPEKRLRLVVRSESKISAGSMVTWLQPRFSP